MPVLLDGDWPSCRIGPFYTSAFSTELTRTLFITIIIESAVVIGYSLWRKKPVRPILYTSLCINLLTQSLLWIALTLFFRHYLIALLTGEILVWIIESLWLYAVPANRLRFREAIFLSLGMNLASFALGWFLPV
jgi:hypothetical protein